MKVGTQDNGIFIDNNNFIGISLGHDYCAEHEWGYKRLKISFGIPHLDKNNLGIKSRSTTKCINNLIFKEETYKKNKYAILFTGSSWRTEEESATFLPYYLENYKKDIEWSVKYNANHPSDRNSIKDPIKTAWDDSSFGIGVMGAENVEYLRELYNALLNKNATFARMNAHPNNPFSNPSLSIMIRDKIPEEYLDAMYGADKKVYDLEEYEEKIGMTKLKEKKGNDNDYKGLHYYMACSPKWIDYDDKDAREKEKKERGTKYDILYWINYSDDDNTHGWFTVEVIKKWLNGKKKLSEITKTNKNDV